MRKQTYGLLVFMISAFILGGCANKESVKTEEPVTSVVVAAPEAPPPPVPEPLPPPVKTEVVQEPVIIPAPQQKTISAETVEKVTLETIYFDFDKSDLREADREILTRNAGIMLGKLKANVQIEGHCDERGSAEYNLALGERRARSSMKYLVTLGVPAERLSIISYGKEKPADPGHNEEAWAKNRRAQFVNMGE